ncbi:MAG: hypothetical protein Q7R81_03240 [Candidatus Peregrinibacteria bacterium]|nr:hypothetical protein [Candidatus Peregrinibacteria bacterium]
MENSPPFGRLPKSAIDRLQRMNAISAPFPHVNLREVLHECRANAEAVFAALAALHTGIGLDEEMRTKLVNNARAGLAEAIGQVWPLVRSFDTPQQEELISVLIHDGYDPLDAVYEYIIYLYRKGAERWEQTVDTSDPVYFNLQVNALMNSDLGDTTPADTIVRGASAGTDITLGILEVIPKRWKIQQGTTISRDELRKSTQPECIHPLISTWKKMKGGSVVITFEDTLFDNYTTLRTLPSGNKRIVLNPEKTELVQTSGGIWVPIPANSVITSMEGMTFSEPQYPSRAYCPASSAYDQRSVEEAEKAGKSLYDQDSVLSQTVKRTIELARKYWVENYS